MEKLVHRIKMMLVKALIKAVDDTKDLQLVKIATLSGITQDGIERLQSYGLTSNPPIDSEALPVYFSGNQDHGVVVVCDSGAYRIKNLETGEVCVYAQPGQKILLNKDGDIETTQGAFKVGSGNDFVALSQKVDTIISTIHAVFNGWLPPAAPTIDNGAALKALWLSTFGTPPSSDSVASANLKAD